MINYDNDPRHENIIRDSAKLVTDLQTLFYVNSNEKSVLKQKLYQILQGRQYNHAIDLGAGPGLVSEVLEQHARQLTLLEITSEYYQLLKQSFPQANVVIESVLDFQFKAQYDLMLFSHVLYYIAVEEWQYILKKLYAHLSPGGTLIVTHNPCHHIHKIFHETLSKRKNIAYMEADAMDILMNQIGPYTKEQYHSISGYIGEPNAAFATKYTNDFFGVTEVDYPQAQLDELLSLFSLIDGKLSIEYHHDIYIFQKI